MEVSIQLIVIILAVLFTAISAGFKSFNLIKPSMGRLNDLGFLQSIQQMNGISITPFFLMLFLLKLSIWNVNKF